MASRAKREMIAGVGAADVVSVGIGKVRRVAVRGPQHALHDGPRVEPYAGELGRRADMPRARLDGRLPAHRFLDG